MIPIIGRVAVWEFFMLLGSAALAVLGTLGFFALGPSLAEIHSPGSGGGAQMIMAMVVYPMVLITCFVAAVGLLGFVVILSYTVWRLHKSKEQPPG